MKLPSRPSLVLPSTKAFLREARRTPRYSLFDRLHGYVYARWPYLYIGLATGEHPLAWLVGPVIRAVGRLSPRWAAGQRPAKDVTEGGKDSRADISFADTYHGKVVPPAAARQLVTVGEPVELRNLDKVIPYALARDIVLRDPQHIVALECPCRAARLAPCLPLDVCLIVGEPFASFVLEHHPRRARWISQEEAVHILNAEHDRGHVHHAFFKDAMLGRFYAICNCCSCCCGAMQAWQQGVPMLTSSGYVSRVDASKCSACGDCVGACPFQALSVHRGVSVVDPARCMGCGVCVSRCERGALALVRDPSRGEPLELQELLNGLTRAE